MGKGSRSFDVILDGNSEAGSFSSSSLAVNDPKGPIEADLMDAVCDPTAASRRAIRLWHPCVDGYI